MCLLIIDDSGVVRNFLTSLLDTMGDRVERFETTRESLEQIATERHIQLFLNMIMSRSDGYKLLDNLITDRATPKQ